MVVQHNLTAMNSNRMLGITQGTVTKSTEKLSSGYKINRAADDAAGLSISEKMRRQIKGLTQASANAQDGISAVQTAEGALAEVHEMLQRMDELATKAANGTMSQSDRQNVQDELDNLLTEIDRVSETTKFNETYLLKGSSNLDDKRSFNLNAKSAGINGTFTAMTKDKDDTTNVTKEQKVADKDLDSSVLNADTKTTVGAVSFSLTSEEVEKIDNLKVGDTYDIGGVVYSVIDRSDLSGNTPNDTQLVLNTSADSEKAHNALKMQIYEKMTAALTKANGIGNVEGNSTSSEGSVYRSADNIKSAVEAFTKSDNAENDFISDDNIEMSWTITKADVEVQAPLSLSLHVGADSLANNKIDLQIDKMNTRFLGIEGMKVTGTDAQNATFAIDAISDAINKVSNQRSTLGAVQNRLEHTIKNVDNVIENTQSAESAIRDTDMATEMVKFSNANILQQAGQSMLAQANQSNQGVLSLLG